jgi:hypothetical protein
MHAHHRLAQVRHARPTSPSDNCRCSPTDERLPHRRKMRSRVANVSLRAIQPAGAAPRRAPKRLSQ